MLHRYAHRLGAPLLAGRRSWRVTDGGAGVFSLETAEVNTFPWIPDYWVESATNGNDARVTWTWFLRQLTTLLGMGIKIEDDNDIEGHTVRGTQASVAADVVAKSVFKRFPLLDAEFSRVPVSV